jgi:glycosyltransferase involved in cell wall biosynthesis
MGDVVPEHYAGVSIEVTDRVSHPEAVAAQQNSDLVLLTFDRKVGESTLTGKLFEYLACGTPIFAVIPTGERAEAANIINKCNAGWVADCDRPAEVVEKLTEAIAIVAQHDFRFSPNFTQIAQYSRERLTGLLASFFNKLVD